MKFLRFLLFPISIIYGIITWLRNLAYDFGILKSHSFDLPIIAVGNLSTGGTGKSPQIEYLLRLFSDKKTATLSRGYKRSTNGFQLADSNSTAQTIGDEPFQFYTKFPNVSVAVDANRVNGVENLLKKVPHLELILLDDAFQHRKLHAGLYILLTAYDALFTDDFPLPTGNLREFRSGMKRAKIIVVTKCPKDLSKVERQKIRSKINPLPDQKVFFSIIEYDDFAYNKSSKIALKDFDQPKVLLAGIAKPKLFFEQFQNPADAVLTFPDHHAFSIQDIENIQKTANSKPILTTEKDYMRLQGLLPEKQLFYVPIQMKIIDKKTEFDGLLRDYFEINKIR